MSASEDFLDAVLFSVAPESEDSDGLDLSGTASSTFVPYFESGYKGSIDYRIRQLSYSSILTLHSCPRRYQLYKLRSTGLEDSLKDRVTFSFGHVVGEAIQLALEGKSEQAIIFHIFTSWHTPTLFDEDAKNGKSIWSAIWALKKFLALRKAGLLDNYELVEYNGRPACELSFCIFLPNGFRYRGFVDAVLRHRISGEILVLECKTTGLKVLDPAMYKNSAQAIGYSIVLDHLFPDLSSYSVLYLVYQTHSEDFTPIPFVKSYLLRALWIRELLMEVQRIEMYEAAGIYPMHGESCYSWNRPCKYINVCTMSNDMLAQPGTPEVLDTFEYQINISLEELLETQLKKVTLEVPEILED